MDSTPPIPDAPCDGHHYVSTACLHKLHTRCRDVCKFCAAPCECPVEMCGHNADAATGEYDLLQRLAVAIHNTPGFDTGDAHPWALAQSILKELKVPDPLEKDR